MTNLTIPDPPPFGVCTWTFGDQPLAEIGRRLVALGFDGVELAGDLARYSPAEAGRILQEHRLQIFSLTPANVDIAHPEPAIRREAIDYYLRLVDFAAELGADSKRPLISCHGYVGRVQPVTDMDEERDLLVQSVQEIGRRAQQRNLKLVFEVLNRYESHLINTGQEALDLIEEIALDNVGVLLDTYHMNIEEPDPPDALRRAGGKLWLYHAADSNRQAVGRGHIDFRAQFETLQEIGYQGPIIFECTAPGPNPFTAIKDENSLTWLETYLQESKSQFP
jgi:sugar phosphate isomerase/epimerase